MFHVRENQDYNRHVTSATRIFYCLSDRTERLIQENVYLPLYVHSLTQSPTRVNETTATNQRGNR